MSDAPGGGAKVEPQAAIAKHAAITQAGGPGDAAIIARVESSIQHSPMGWLQGVLGETSSRSSAESGEVHGKIAEHEQLVSSNQKDAPKDAGTAPAPGPAAHPAVPSPATAAPAAAAAPKTAEAAGGAAANHAVPAHPVTAAKGAAAPSAPAPTVAAAVSGAGDGQIDGILNAYTPKSPQATQTMGRIKQMGDVAQGFNGQLDTYVAQGGNIEHAVAASANFLGVGKDASAVWANNPYRKVHGVLGGIMTGLSSVKSVCAIVGSICGKIGMVLTVIGLLGMIFPPIGAAVSGIARILNVVGVICDAIAFVLSGILTGLNGVVLAQQIGAGASAEEKAATADLMMTEANDAASGFVNLAMMFGPKFMKGMLGSSKGIVASLLKRARATIGRISLKVSANVGHFANKIVRKLGFGGAGGMARVGGAWKSTSFISSAKEKFAASAAGKAFNGAPGHIQGVQDKLMAKYGNTGWAKNMDRMGAWGGSVAHRFDLEDKVGKLGESSGKAIGGLGAESAFGKRLAASAERSEFQTRELTMKMGARDAAHLEESRWKRELDRRGASAPEGRIRSKEAEGTFVASRGDNVRREEAEKFQHAERGREQAEHVERMKAARTDRRNDEYLDNKTNGLTGASRRDEMMGSVHGSRQKRWDLEAQFKAQETERKALLGKATKTSEEQARLTALNGELRSLDEARRINKLYEKDLSGLSAGHEREREQFSNWKDVGSNAWEAVEPMGEMMGLQNKGERPEDIDKKKWHQAGKYNKGTAKSTAAGRGGHGTFGDIAKEQRDENLQSVTEFVRAGKKPTSVSGSVRGMLSGITSRGAKPQQAAASQAAPTAAQPRATAPAPQVSVTPQVTGEAHPAPSMAQEPEQAKEAPDADAGDALPYWPALLPEFDQASHDFGWMRKVATEFKKAQIEGKQKAVNTLAVYGRYKEYAQARAAAAAKNQQGAQQTGAATQQNVAHASQTEGQAGQGEAKQAQAKGAASDKAATDLPEPASTGFWGNILGAVKRWAKNKAAQVFGWIQEKIASVIMKGLCGVSMGDMREYAGALRHQQQLAHGVADGAGAKSGQVQSTSVKLGADANKEAQDAADGIGECDKNITDADTFMADIASFEQQLAEEKAYAQVFITNIHTQARAEQAKRAAEAATRDQARQQAAALPVAGAAQPAAEPESQPAAAAAEEPATANGPEQAPEQQQDEAQIHAASAYVATEADAMTSKIEGRADDYTNQLAFALMNRTGKDDHGVDLKGPAKQESKHIVEAFKEEAKHTKLDMDAMRGMAIDPTHAHSLADTIIQSATHLESSYDQSENALDELFTRTYQAIKDGKRSLKSQIFDGDNAIGHANEAGEELGKEAVSTALPQMNKAWDKVAKPIAVPASATPPRPPAPTPAPIQPSQESAEPEPVHKVAAPQTEPKPEAKHEDAAHDAPLATAAKRDEAPASAVAQNDHVRPRDASSTFEASAERTAAPIDHQDLLAPAPLAPDPAEKKKRDDELAPTHAAHAPVVASHHDAADGKLSPETANANAVDHRAAMPSHLPEPKIVSEAREPAKLATNLQVDGHGSKPDHATHAGPAAVVDSEGNQHAYDPLSGKAPAPKASAKAHPSGFAKPAPAPEIPPAPQTANQEAINAFIAKARTDRDSQKANVQTQQLAKSAQVSVDANVIAQQVKQKNDVALASMRAKVEAEKQLASQKATEQQQQQGPVSIESLSEKLEQTAMADKEKLKAGFDEKQAELKVRLDTQKQTLQAESQKQIENFVKQNEEKKKVAEAAWVKQKAQMEATSKSLMEKMRSQVAADQTRLEKDKALLFAKANERIAKIDADAAANAAKVRADGAKKSGELQTAAADAAKAERAKGTTQAQSIRTEAQTKVGTETDEAQKKKLTDDANARATAAQATSEHAAGNLEIKGKLNAKAATDEAEVQANKVLDAGKKSHDDVNTASAHQIDAIAEKINQLGPLADEKIKKAETDLATQQKAGEAKLSAQFQDTQTQVAKLKAEADTKIAKFETDGLAKLQKDYDAGIATVDKHVALARLQLASGNQKNLKALEQMVDQTCKTLDKSVTDTEAKFEHTVADAEKQAQAFVIAQVQKIKAEADKALLAIDQHYGDVMKRMDDAVAATTRQIEETAKGKMLEVEVHTATLLNDTGDPSRLNAVTKQLRTYIEEKKPLPPGYGDTAAGTPSAAPATAAAAATAPKADAKTEEKKPGEAVSPADKIAEEARKKLLDPNDLSEAGVQAKLEESLKKGRKQTAGTAADTADKAVAAQYKSSTEALTTLQANKNTELTKLQAGDEKAVAEVEKVRTDDDKGRATAHDIDKAMQQTNWYGGKSPDKKAILQALHDKTPEQIAAMREALAARTPKINLDDFITKEMSGGEQTEARIRMTGDPIAGDIAALNNAAGHKLTGNEKLAIAVGGGITGGLFLNQQGDQNVGADKERVEQILRQYKGADLQKFAAQYEAQTGRPLGDLLHSTGNDAAAKELGFVKKDERSEKDIKTSADADASKLLADPNKKINPAKCGSAVSDLSEALQGFHLDSTRAEKVRAALDGKTPDEMAYLRAEYKAKTGHDLDRDMNSQLNGAALAETKATLRGDENQAAVAKILGAEEASWTPWTVDDSKMNEELKSIKDPAQRRAVLAAYEKRTGRKLQDVIAEKMTGNDRELATALANGDELKARMVELDEATNGGFLNGMHKAIAERSEKATGINTEGFTRGLTNALIAPQNLFTSNPEKVTMPGGYVLENGSIHKVDSDAMFKILEETPNPADREKLKILYKQQTGHNMDDDMAKSLVGPMGDRSKLDAYKAIQDGRMEDYYAAKMDDAVSGLNDTKAFHAQLEGKSERERKLIIDAFNQRHGGDANAFATVCNDQFGADSMDAQKAKLLASEKDDAKTGTVKLPDEFTLKYAQDSVWNRTAKSIDGATAIFDKYPLLMAIPGVGMEVQNAKTASFFMRGWGVDNDAIKNVLKDKSPAEIAELKSKYPELEKDLGYCLSGRDAFEVNLMLADGAPQTPEEKIKRQLALYEFDRGASGSWIPSLGLNKVSNGITDLISPSGQMLDAEAAGLKKQLAMLQAGGQLSTEQQKQLDMSLALMDSSTTNFIASREEITGAIATAVGAVVGAVVTVMTGGVGGAVLAALATGLSTVAVKCAMLGQSYGRNEMGVDLAMTAVQMATAGIGGGISKLSESFMVQVLNGAIGAAASNFAQTAITSKDAHDLLGLLAQASKSGLVGMLSGGANAAATAALSNAMSQLSAKSFGKDAPLAGIFVKGFVSGAGGSVAGMFAEAIVDPSTMSGDWDKVFANAAMGAAQAGLQNGLTEAAQEHHQRGVEVLKSATEAANAKKEAGATIEDQRAAFAKVMSEGYAGLASHEPAPHEQKPEEIQAQREKQQAPDENHAPRDEINGKPVESIKGEMDRVAQKETPPEELQPKEARRGKVDEAAHAADVASVLGGMEAGEVPGKLPHDQIDKNTAEAIKSGAVELITRESLRSMGGDLYMDDHGNVITWKKGTAAQAVGNRVYVDPTVGPEALRMDLRHEVNHALHEADFGSKYDGDSLSRFRDEIRAHSAELGPNPTREQLEIVMSHVMASYPELGARIAEMPPEQLEAIAKQHSQGNTINSVRLMPVYDAIENFHAFDEHPSREKLEEMFGKLDKHDRQALGDDPAFQQWLNQDLALPPAEIEKLWEKLGTGHDELPEPAPSNEKFAQRSGPDEEGLAAKEKRFWEVKTPEPTPESEGTPEEMGPAAERAQARNQREVEAAKSRIEGEELRKAQADYDRKFQQAVDEIRTRTGNHDADDLTADYQAAVKLGDRPEQLTQTEREAVEKRARLEVLNDELGRGVRAKDQEKFQEQRERQELDFKRDASAPEDLDAQVRIHDEELAEKVSKYREENDGAKEFTDEQIEGIVREKQVSSEIAAGEDLKGVKQKMQEALPKLAEKGLLKAVEQLGGAAAKEAVKAHLRTFDHIDGKARPQELGESIAKVVKEGLKAAANLKDPSGKLAEMVEFAFEEGIKARPDIVYKLGEQAIKLKGLVSPEERSFANPENPGRAGDTDERFAKSVADPGVVTPAEAADGRTRRESIKDHEEREAAANELRELTTPPAEASREAQESLGRKQGSVDPVEIAVVHDESSAKLDDLDSRKPDAPRTKTPAEAEPVVAHEELRQPLAAHVDEVPTASAAHEETEPQADAHEEAPKFRVANDEQNQSQQREAEALKDRLTNDEEDHHSAGSFAEDPAEARRQLQVPGPERPIESAIDVNDPRVKAKGELVKAAEARVTAADERVNAALRKGDIDGVRAATGDKRTAQKQLEILAATPAERFTPTTGETAKESRRPANQLNDREQTAIGSRDERIAAQQEKGHSGIEVHSHFMGNVEPGSFVEKLASSSKPDARASDLSPLEPLLRQIGALNEAVGKDGKPAMAHHFSEQIDPVTNKKLIETRGPSGDALEHVKIVQDRLVEYKLRLESPTLTEAEKQSIREQARSEVQSAVDKALRASNETDFNSAYEIRDELVKKFYGDDDRAKILGDKADASFAEQTPRYREHFADRPRVLETIKEASELQAKLDGGGLSPDEQQKATAELKNKRKAIEEQVAYDAYAKDTLLRLANDGITYTEQSNSLKKMAQRFDPEQIESLKKQLIAEHPELAAQISALEVKHLVMITTNEFGPRDQRLDQRDQKSADRKNKRDFTDQIQPIIEQVRRGDTTGVDIAGAEFYTFDAEGQRRMQHLYGRLLGEAMGSGKVIVLRPHVGEGANDTEHGKHYNRDGDRQLVDGEASHYSRAKANLDAMLTAFEVIARSMGSEQLPPEVVVRFGHATHTTPEQAVRMAKLGIIAEVNLASNVQTGSLNQGKIEDGADQHRGRESILSPHDASARGHGNMDDHALATLVAEGVRIILSTDAHSVMSTDMKDQYDRANQIVREVIAGGRKVKIKTEHGTVEQSYEEMSPQLKQRFNEAERKFYEDANAYYEKQKGVTREGQPSESEPQA